MANLHSRAVVAGVFVGLIGITQPTVAAISSGLFMVALLLTCSIGEAFKVWVIANSCALLIVAATTSLFYPFGILEWIDGLLRQAAGSAARTDKDGFFRYWILSRERPLHGIIVIVAAAALGWATLVHGMRSGAAIVYCLTMGFVWYVSVRIPAAVYNAMAFVPVLVALGADRLSRTKSRGEWRVTLACGIGRVISRGNGRDGHKLAGQERCRNCLQGSAVIIRRKRARDSAASGISARRRPVL